MRRHRAIGTSGHRALVMIATRLVPAGRRAVLREQWLADLRDAAELGIPPHQISLGALRASATARTHDPGVAMLPIGPLALGVRLGHRRGGVALVVAFAALLLIGIGLLLVP